MSGEESLVAWLRTQVEARKTAAKLAAREGGAWTQDGVHTGNISSLGGQVVYDEGSPDEYQAAHIALNDPQDVIARCEAELAILDLYDRTLAIVRTPVDLRALAAEKPVIREMRARDYLDAERELCVLVPVVALLASGYRHRPGYREEWKP